MKEVCRVFLRALAAGIAIAVGGTVYLSLENKIVGALLFTVGLYVIVLNGLNLYTGKIGYLVDQRNRRLIYGCLLLHGLGTLREQPWQHGP